LLARADLYQRRKFGHYYRGRDCEQLALIRQRLGMVACGGGNDSAFLLVRRQLCQRVARAAFLEASGSLQVVELTENFLSGDSAQGDRRRTRRIINRARDALARRFDILKRDQAI